MSEIVLSFFAVIGITLLGLLLFDRLAYRHRRYNGKLILDLRGKCTDERWDMIECAAYTYRKPCGRSVMGEVILLIESDGAEEEEKLLRYLSYFDLPGSVVFDDKTGMIPLQNMSAKEGERER